MKGYLGQLRLILLCSFPHEFILISVSPYYFTKTAFVKIRNDLELQNMMFDYQSTSYLINKQPFKQCIAPSLLIHFFHLAFKVTEFYFLTHFVPSLSPLKLCSSSLVFLSFLNTHTILVISSNIMALNNICMPKLPDHT